MPTPVPDHVTEAWLLPSNVVRQYLSSDYDHHDANGARCRAKSLTLEARDKAARLLYENLSEGQVASLRTDGEFKVGECIVYCSDYHPRIKFHKGSYTANSLCIAFGSPGHELLPMCDRLLAMKLHIEINNLKTYDDFKAHAFEY